MPRLVLLPAAVLLDELAPELVELLALEALLAVELEVALLVLALVAEELDAPAEGAVVAFEEPEPPPPPHAPRNRLRASAENR